LSLVKEKFPGELSKHDSLRLAERKDQGLWLHIPKEKIFVMNSEPARPVRFGTNLTALSYEREVPAFDRWRWLRLSPE
jgi:hypothetical protein